MGMRCPLEVRFVVVWSVLAPVCGKEMSRTTPVPRGGLWRVAGVSRRQHSQNRYCRLDEAETKRGRITPWNQNHVGVMHRPQRDVLC